jgi:hypothetical protein
MAGTIMATAPGIEEQINDTTLGLIAEALGQCSCCRTLRISVVASL